ncbi:MAG: lipopolysaccharide biosynthesis protein [Bacteroidaceae bacterium]|nr:lipopolysaccharide biosynthesis protein [Bacteroidaceae bacterium]
MQKDKSLTGKAVKGAGWSFLDNISNQGITFLIGLVLARLLSPEEYGLIGIITIFISVFNTIVDSGFSNALIRNNSATDVDYSTGFITNIVFSSFLYLLLFFISPFISFFFDEPRLTLLLRVMGCIIIINSFAIIQRTILVKRVDFKTQTYISFISSLSSGIIGIGMAITGFKVWALVGQLISRQLFNTCLLWVFNKWRPSIMFSLDSFYSMWTFGWKLLVSSLLDTGWKEIYQVVIGKCYSPITLGLYTRAKQFGDIFSMNLTSIVQRVTYPVLSEIQDDKIRLKIAYKRVIRATMLPTFVLMLGMAASAKSMVNFLVGSQWVECVPMLQFICSFGMLYPLHALNLNMLQVQGRSDLFLRLEIIKKIIGIAPLLLGVFVGIYWMLAGTLVTSFFAYYLNAYYSGPFLNYSIKEQVKDILPAFSIAILAALPVFALNWLSISVYMLFPLQIIVGALFTIAICEKINLPEYNEIKNNIVRILQKKTN